MGGSARGYRDRRRRTLTTLPHTTPGLYLHNTYSDNDGSFRITTAAFGGDAVGISSDLIHLTQLAGPGPGWLVDGCRSIAAERFYPSCSSGSGFVFSTQPQPLSVSAARAIFVRENFRSDSHSISRYSPLHCFVLLDADCGQRRTRRPMLLAVLCTHENEIERARFCQSPSAAHSIFLINSVGFIPNRVS